MVLASRNSMTYLKPIGFIGRLANIFNRCQSRSYEEQYERGVRVFDIRISFKDNNRNVIFRNGRTAYYTFSFFEVIHFFNKKMDCTVRLSLDSTNAVDPDFQRSRFLEVCNYIEEIYPFVKFCGGTRLSNDECLYLFKHEHENGTSRQIDIFFDGTSRWNKFCGWCRKSLRAICPRLHAWLFNNYYIQRFSDQDGLLILDFV